jgi:hypothetical protein
MHTYRQAALGEIARLKEERAAQEEVCDVGCEKLYAM